MSRQPRTRQFAPYLPRIVNTWPDEGGAEHLALDGSLVFVDISGFTALSERLARKGRMGAEELTGTLSRCFANLLALAYAGGGSLLKFGGDALLLLFDGDGHPDRACTAAVQMRAAMRETGRVDTSVGLVRLRMSVGVHSGPMHLFRVGESHRELIITGPGASATVAMESIAQAGEIVVSPATADRVGGRWIKGPKEAGFLLRNRNLEVPDVSLPGLTKPSADLGRYIPTALRAELGAGAVESEHRYATIAFIHFDGTDAVLETRGAAAVAGALHSLVVQVQGAAEEYGVTFLGTDVDRDGGKIILVGGAPRALGGDEERMLRTLRAAVRGGGDLPVRIGVNRGHVFVGEVGPAYRRTFTVMGDAVNLAARLMARAGTAEILATSEVLDCSSTPFATEPLPPFMVKGKSEPVEAFAVGDRLERAEAAANEVLPFCGREAEAGAVRRVLDELLDGFGGHLLDVSGPSGIGKSRLISEVSLPLRESSQLQTVTTWCDPYETKTPYYAVRFLLRGLLGLQGFGEVAGAELTAAVMRTAPHLTPWTPLLATVIDAAVPLTEEVAALEPRFRRERTRWSVLELLRSAVHQPTVFIVEDGQWLDELSAELIHEATVENGGFHPWLVCVVRNVEPGAYRPPDDVPTVAVPLGPLDDGAARALIAAAMATAPPEPHVRDALVAQAGGNPLFLRELVRSQHSYDGAELPNTLESLIAAEIDRLSPRDRRLLRCTAVLGTVFESDLLADLLEEVEGARITTATVARRLRAFLEPAGANVLRFRNQCHRQVAYETLPFGRRRELHARAGDAIEMRAGANVVDRAAALSFHYLHALRYEQGWHYARLGAEHARAQYANVEAVELYERALKAAAHLQALDGDEVAATWEALGDVALLANTFERARTAFGRAARLRQRLPNYQALIYRKQAITALFQGKPDAAVRWVRRGLRLLGAQGEQIDLSARAELRAMYGQICLRTGRHVQAVRWCESAVEDAITSGNRRALATAYRILDWALIDLGRSTEAVYTSLALGIWAELGDLNQQAQVLATLGAFAYWQGAWDEAVAFNRRARETSLRAGNLNDAATVATNGAEILIAQGRHDEAEADLRDALELFRAFRQRMSTAEALKCLGVIALRRGERADARARFEEARDLVGDARETLAFELDGWLAECHVRDGRVREAIALTDAALSAQAASGATTFAPMLHRIRGCAYRAAGMMSEGWHELDTSLRIARSRGASYEIALTLDAIAAAAVADGLPADPAADDERLHLLERLGVRWMPPPLTVGAGDTVLD